jgi:hypothetical protein
MKIFTLILIVLAIILIGYNIKLLDFDKPFQGDSAVALIGIVASICAVLILLIFRMSKMIIDRSEDK